MSTQMFSLEYKISDSYKINGQRKKEFFLDDPNKFFIKTLVKNRQ